MWNIKAAVVICLFTVGSAAVCRAEDDNAISGRELLRAVRERAGAPAMPAPEMRSARTAADTNHPTVSELMDKYAENQNQIRSFIIKTEGISDGENRFTSDNPRIKKLSGKQKTKAIVEFRTDGNRVNFRGQKWGKDNLDSQWNTIGDCKYTSYLWDAKQFTRYATTGTNLRQKGWVEVDKGFDLRKTQEKIRPAFAYNRFLGYPPIVGSARNVERIDALLQKAQSATVRDKPDIVGGSQCYVIDAVMRGGKYTLWIDPEHGYNIAKADIDSRGGDTSSTTISRERSQSSWEVVRFEKNGNVWLPMEIVAKDCRTYKTGDFEKSTLHTHVTEATLNPDHEALGSFVSDDIPNGARAFVVGVRGLYTWQDGQVVNAEGRKVSLDPNNPQPEGSVGKALPDLKGLGINLEPNEAKNKVILVCFFDMNQRPSRHIVTELVKRAEQLKQKDVVITALQASQVDAKSLAKWIEENGVPFPVGIIPGDFQKVRLDCGVKSLPWLVLTNRRYFVAAEGFKLEELDDRIKEVENAGR